MPTLPEAMTRYAGPVSQHGADADKRREQVTISARKPAEQTAVEVRVRHDRTADRREVIDDHQARPHTQRVDAAIRSRGSSATPPPFSVARAPAHARFAQRHVASLADGRQRAPRPGWRITRREHQ
jgi:hypothetical protein